MEFLHAKTGNQFLDRLNLSNFGLLRPFLSEVELDRGAELFVPGDEVETVWFPVGAILSVVTLMLEGEGIEACTIGHESAYGLLNTLGDPTAIDRVIAQVPGTSLRMPSYRLRAAATISSSLTEHMIRHAQLNLAQTQQSVACNAVHQVEARLCRWLLMSQDRSTGNKLPLTQEFLGFMLGVRRTTVTGAAKALQDAGLIRYFRGQIEILDRKGLEAAACECYEAVREKRLQLLGDGPPRIRGISK